MRLVDVDALLFELANESFPQSCTYAQGRNGVIESIRNAPTIDAVPVVRCKDCKWFDKQRRVCHDPRYGDGYANYQPPNTNDEYWCADGERKDNGAD